MGGVPFTWEGLKGRREKHCTVYSELYNDIKAAFFHSVFMYEILNR